MTLVEVLIGMVIMSIITAMIRRGAWVISRTMTMRCRFPPESDLAGIYREMEYPNLFSVSSISVLTACQSIPNPPERA